MPWAKDEKNCLLEKKSTTKNKGRFLRFSFFHMHKYKKKKLKLFPGCGRQKKCNWTLFSEFSSLEKKWKKNPKNNKKKHQNNSSLFSIYEKRSFCISRHEFLTNKLSNWMRINYVLCWHNDICSLLLFCFLSCTSLYKIIILKIYRILATNNLVIHLLLFRISLYNFLTFISSFVWNRI